jgi:hypothetical protein
MVVCLFAAGVFFDRDFCAGGMPAAQRSLFNLSIAGSKCVRIDAQDSKVARSFSLPMP